MRIWLNSLVLRYWAPPVIWAVVIMMLSGDLGAFPNSFSLVKWVLSLFVTLPAKTVSLLHMYFRKSLHVICYGILSVLWFRALMASRPGRLWGNFLLALVLCLTVAIIDEGHQHVLTSRTGTVSDVFLDLSGAVFFTLVAAFFGKWQKMEAVAAQPHLW